MSKSKLPGVNPDEVIESDPQLISEAGEKKTRKSPVPANAERITEGALNLPIEERIDLNKKLAESITNEMVAAKKKIEDLSMKLSGVK